MNLSASSTTAVIKSAPLSGGVMGGSVSKASRIVDNQRIIGVASSNHTNIMSGGGDAAEEIQQMLESRKRLFSAQNGARRKRTTTASNFIEGGGVVKNINVYQTERKTALTKTGGGSQFNEKDLF
jgi:hypothetical protein